MSLLAELLSKIKYKRQKVDVPPSLISDITTSQQTRRRRIIVLLILLVFVVGSGVAALVFLEDYLKPELILTRRPLPTSPPVVDTKIPLTPPTQTGIKKDTPAEQREAKPPKRSQRVHRTVMEKGKSERTKRPVEDTIPTEKEVIKEDKVGHSPVTQQEPVIDIIKRDHYVYRARTFELQGQIQEAINMYKKAAEVDPDNHIILSNISGLMLKINNPEEALNYAKLALQKKNGYIPGLINLAVSLFMLDQKIEAEQTLLSVLNTEPANPMALNNLAIFYERAGELDKAKIYYKRLYDLGNSNGYLGLARVSEREGRMLEALSIYQEVLASEALDTNTKAIVNDRITYIKSRWRNPQNQ